MWEDILKVFEHGAKKHKDVQPFLEQLEHIKTHYILFQAVECEKESGLPHKAHCAARLLLALNILYPGSVQLSFNSDTYDILNLKKESNK